MTDEIDTDAMIKKFDEDRAAAEILAQKCSEIFAEKDLAVIGLTMISLAAYYVCLSSAANGHSKKELTRLLAVAIEHQAAEIGEEAVHTVN